MKDSMVYEGPCPACRGRNSVYIYGKAGDALWGCFVCRALGVLVDGDAVTDNEDHQS
jgi:hypothetical protein